MRLGTLCWCIPALNCGAANIDHFHCAWSGTSWRPNPIEAPHLAYQKAFFPLATQGPGAVALPPGAFILRLAIFAEEFEGQERILSLWGRVTENQERPLATLIYRHGQLVWHCPVDEYGDTLFDAKTPVELTTALPTGRWVIKDTLVHPKLYRQTLGWNQAMNRPEDPAKRTSTSPLHMARQSSSAPWTLTRIEVHAFRKLWIGQIEVLPEDTPPEPTQFNVIRVR